MNTDDSPAQRAADSHRQATALAALAMRAEQDPALGAILADVDALYLEQRLTLPGLRAEVATAEKDASFDAASAEMKRRVIAAGGNRVCACGDSALRHAHRFTDDTRLPCTVWGCLCDDLTLDQRDPR